MIRPKSLAKILRALCVRGNELVDFGSGSGRVLFSDVSEGAFRAYGYELPVKKGMKHVFDAAMRTSVAVADLRNAVPAQAQLPAAPLAPRIGMRRLSSRRASK